MSKLKRIHLFEIEDQSWFPNWIRDCMTRAIKVLHVLLKTNNDLPRLLAKVLKETKTNKIIDLCSGGGGPMIEAVEILRNKYELKNIQLQMTDLFPHLEFADKINNKNDGNITYSTEPVNALNIPASTEGLRTMICSFHHMRPSNAKQILRNAQESKRPILIYEMSDNKPPILLSLFIMPISLVITFFLCLFVTIKVRPLTWQQVLFTYLIPIIPLCFSWDGVVSNVRTYTIDDMKKLLQEFKSEDYEWDAGTIEGKPSGKLYLIGKPQ